MRHTPFQTIVHAFIDSLEQKPEETAIRVIEPSRDEFDLTYADLYREACRTAKGFQELGITSGDCLLLMLPTSRAFFSVYLAAVFTGVRPIVLTTPRLNQPSNSFVEHLHRLTKDLGGKYIVVTEEMHEAIDVMPGLNPVTVETLCQHRDSAHLDLAVNPEDIAHFQATSGSTSTPKLAVVRHGNIAANVQAIGKAIRHRTGDILVTWLPFYHDMGIVGLSYAINWQCPFIAADPINFVRNPIFWLRLLSRFRGTLSPAPNSAFQICARLAQMRTFDDLDLSSWRVALCGSEPVHEETIERFYKAFARYGYQEKTMLPVYGLAEATLAASIPDPDAAPLIDTIDADTMETTMRCLPPTRETTRTLNMVSVGKAIPGHRVRVVDREGLPLGERHIGEIEFSGPSVISGYWGDRQNTDALKRPDGFLRTGDLGYMADGQVFISGRSKDIIIIHGRNFISNQIEALLQESCSGTKKISAVACGIPDEKSGTEMLHIVVEDRSASSNTGRVVLEEKIQHVLEDVLGIGGVTVHWIPKGQIPKTSSGKIQRYRIRKMIQDRRLCASPPKRLTPLRK